MQDSAATRAPLATGVIPQIWSRDRPLAATGSLMFAALLVILFIAPFDSRSVLGLNTWVKPVKFLLSVGLYLWTLAWFMPYARGPVWLTRAVSWGVSISLLVENTLIVMQGARGVPSHFNFETAFDGRVFSLMGLMIAANSVFLAGFAWMLFRRPAKWPRLPYLWAVRIGVLLLLVASAEGALMIANGAHAVGVPDGGPGVRLMNFSTVGGDLRVAHLLGLHAFQFLPLFAFYVRRRSPELDERRQARIVVGFAAFYTVAMVLLFWQAMAGQPVV